MCESLTPFAACSVQLEQPEICRHSVRQSGYLMRDYAHVALDGGDDDGVVRSDSERSLWSHSPLHAIFRHLDQRPHECT